MANIQRISPLTRALREAYTGYLQRPQHEHIAAFSASAGRSMALSQNSTNEASVVPQYSIQRALRPFYGKGEPQLPKIGDHPDFMHLKGTDRTEHGAITTLFMDIEGSTRFNLLFPLEQVRQVKHAILCAASEIVSSFDGHVHRLQGDAVIAYFGRKGGKPESGVIDALHCASILLYFVQQTVIPQLQDQVGQHDFGIRIGIDHGKKEDVLWSCYGYAGMDEVTATSLFVDMSSKLQRAAPRNQIMVGQSLRDFLDIPDVLLTVKRIVENGKQVADSIILPNITDRYGKPLNYKKFVFNWREYLRCSPVAYLAQDLLSPGTSALDTVRIMASFHDNYGGPANGPCIASGTMVPKGKWLQFMLAPPDNLQFPCDIEFRVENHGAEAAKIGGDNLGNHDRSYQAHEKLRFATLQHWEHTAFRGLHYLIVDILRNGVTTHSGRFGVFIE